MAGRRRESKPRNQKIIMSNWISNFIYNLKEILGKPPYLIFVFISAVFVVVSMIWNRNFSQVWIFFLYSIVGAVWRYIEKDVDSGISKIIKEDKAKISHLIIISIYHVGNIILLVVLIRYLYLIK